MSTIATRLGKVRGLDDGNVTSFLGLRYGEPPIGARRFRVPVMAGGWQGTFDATAYPNRAMQGKPLRSIAPPVPGGLSEDCLNLNIATPSTVGAKRPVLFWIHGGGFINGSANEYDGSVLARQGDVVVVTVNYRLGTFGFLDLSAHGDEFRHSASHGVLDLILALQWVHENIEEYGGDPANVTIFGESSGGSLVLSLLAAPAADQLYHKAIAHSATCVFRLPTDRTDQIAERMGVDRTEFVNTIMTMSAQDILDLNLRFGVTVDGQVITRSSLDAIKDRGASGVPLITGTNLREGTLYTWGDDAEQDHYRTLNLSLATEMLLGGNPEKYLQALHETYPDASPGKFHEMIWTDMFRRICSHAAEAASLAGSGGWLYRFDLPANLPGFQKLGATHASEMAFTFNAFADPDSHTKIFHDRNDPVVRAVAKSWSDTIIRFARSGDPNGAELPEWPVYEPGERNCLIINEDFGIESDPDTLHRSLWEA